MTFEISETLIHAISWTVVHSLWQASLVALILSVVYAYVPKKQSNIRYNIGLTGLFVTTLLGIITFLLYYMSSQSSGEQLITATEIATAEILISQAALESEGWLLNMRNYGSVISQVWLVGVIIMGIKLMIGYGYIQYLNHPSGLRRNPDLEIILQRLQSRFQLRTRIMIAETNKVVSPMVSGFVKPLILFPVGMINQLELHEVEAILAHEIAHIKRNDWIINLLQSLVEVIFYYHPAVWWMSSRVRQERENCCDDFAIAQGYDRITYARILVKLKEQELQSNSGLALSFYKSKNTLMNRIKRILGQSTGHSSIREKLIALALIGTVAVAYAGTFMAPEKLNIPLLNEDKELTLDYDHYSEIALPSIHTMIQDTVPKRKRSKAFTMKQNDGKSYRIESENGEITRLEVDGEVIPPEDYDEYLEEIESNGNWDSFNFEDGSFRMFNMDDGPFFQFGEMEPIEIEEFSREMSRLAEKMGKFKFDGMHEFDWDGFGNMEFHSFDLDSLTEHFEGMNEEHQLKMEELMHRLNEMNLEGLEELKELERFEHMKGLEKLERLKELEGLEGLEGLRGFENFNFVFPDFEGFDYDFGGTVNQKIGRSLNQDGLLKIGTENEVELTGKHLKINGEKQPSNIHDKYKRIFEKSTGMNLTDDSKVKFNVTGKESKGNMRRI